VIRTYLEYVLELPWRKSSKTNSISRKRAILDEDHYGLEDVKERILEFLAVIKLRPDTKSPILCLLDRRESARLRWEIDRARAGSAV
jgi:ATP-dependent Lon protease